MPTSTGGFKSSIEDGLKQYSVLPPIQTASGKNGACEVSPQRLASQRKLLRHRRIKDHQQELQKIMMDSAMQAYKQATDAPPSAPQPLEPQLTTSKVIENRRNYMFLKQCVEASPIVPIQQQWLDAMLMRVPPQLRQGPGRQELLEELCKEVSENFMRGMVQHTVNTVLQKPDAKAAQLERPNQVSEAKVLDFSRPWRDSFVKNRKEMKKNLHILHPVMRITLDMCVTTFSNLLLVDLSDCRSTGPVDCVTLKNKVALECDKVEDKLMNTWFPKVIHLLTSKDMIQGVKPDKLDSFYNCASTLISNQLKSLVARSVDEFVSLFSPSRAYKLPLFRMDLTFDDEKMEFYPSFQDLEEAVMEILNKITNTMQVGAHDRNLKT